MWKSGLARRVLRNPYVMNDGLAAAQPRSLPIIDFECATPDREMPLDGTAVSSDTRLIQRVFPRPGGPMMRVGRSRQCLT